MRFYIDLINAAYRTGASEPLRAYADDECDSCSSIADAVDEIYASGGSARGGLLTVTDLTASSVAVGITPTVDSHVEISRFTELNSVGEVVDTAASRRDELLFELDWSSGWTVVAIRHPRATG